MTYNKKLHAETYYYARFCVFRVAPFYTETLSVICSGELGVNVYMKFTIAALIIVVVSVASYALGYRHGGEDLVYMDHIMVGLISKGEASNCDDAEIPEECYRQFRGLETRHAVYFYNSSWDSLSPLAKHIFPDAHNGYLTSVGFLGDSLAEEGAEGFCVNIHPEKDEEFQECTAEVGRFVLLAAPHINNSLKSGTPKIGAP